MAETSLFEVWLNRRIAEHDYTNESVAAGVGVNASTVQRWRKGEMLPDRRQVSTLAKFFKVSPVTILKLTDPDVLFNLETDAGRQEELLSLLADVPEIRAFVDNLRRLSPDRRAAWLLILQDKHLSG